MARSTLGSFVSGARQMLAVQLFISIGAVALAGWTLSVTNELIRERNRLNERVIQLEQSMSERGIVVPGTPAVVAAPERTPIYPGEVGLDEAPPPPGENPPEPQAPAQQEPPTPRPAPTQAEPGTPETPPETKDPASPPPAATPRPLDRTILERALGQIFAPAPPLRTIVLHARTEADGAYAARLARELMAGGDIRVVVDVLPPRDGRQSGYSYFDGRQSAAAAAMVQRFNDLARQREIAAWSAQLRGVALPAQGEYTADRLDIVLPPLQTGAPAPSLRMAPQTMVRP